MMQKIKFSFSVFLILSIISFDALAHGSQNIGEWLSESSMMEFYEILAVVLLSIVAFIRYRINTARKFMATKNKRHNSPQ